MTYRYRDYAPRGRKVILPGDFVKPSFDLQGRHRVALQCLTEPPLDVYLTEKLGQTAFVVPPVQLATTVTLAPGHGFVVDDYMEVWDYIQGRFLQERVRSVTGDVIGIYRPLDVAYHPLSLVFRTSNRLNVLGTFDNPRVFSFAPIFGNFHMTRMNLIMTHPAPGDDSKIGSLPELINGAWSRYATDVGIYFNVWVVKTNGDLRIRYNNLTYTDKAGAGLYSTIWSMIFGGQGGQGTVYEFPAPIGGRMELFIRDDLTGLNRFQFIIQGHLCESFFDAECALYPF